MTEPRVSDVIASINSQIMERRARGEYPLGLEQQLEAEFSSILRLTHQDELGRRDRILDKLDATIAAMKKVDGRIPAKSRVPGAAIFHKAVSLITRRQTVGLANQVRAVNKQLSVLLELLAADSAGHADADMRLVQSLSRHVVDRVAIVDHLMEVVADLEDRIRILESGVK